MSLWLHDLNNKKIYDRIISFKEEIDLRNLFLIYKMSLPA